MFILGLMVGALYILVGLLGATVVDVFSAFPRVCDRSTLLSTIGQAQRLPKNERESALITFLVTVSSISLFGIGSLELFAVTSTTS